MSSLAANKLAGHKGNGWNWRRISVGLVAGLVLLIGAANAHLVYVAVTSQPECVPHEKGMDASDHPGSYRAAKSAC